TKPSSSWRQITAAASTLTTTSPRRPPSFVAMASLLPSQAHLIATTGPALIRPGVASSEIDELPKIGDQRRTSRSLPIAASQSPVGDHAIVERETEPSAISVPSTQSRPASAHASCPVCDHENDDTAVPVDTQRFWPSAPRRHSVREALSS